MLLARMQSILGKMLKNFAINAEYSEELVDNKGRILKYRDIKHFDINEVLCEYLDESETKEFINLLFNMLNYFCPNQVK